MLDPALCDRLPSQWLSLKEILSNWLMTPPLVILPLFALTVLPWIIPLRWKRQLSSLGAALLLAYFTAFFPPAVALANQGLVGLLPVDSGATTADAIVVLGRGEQLRNSRTRVVAQLWQDGRGRLVFASGRGDAPQLVQLLRAKGVPLQVLDAEQCSQTTEENARFTAAVLQPQGVRQILLVTDPPHMLRSLLTFRSVGFTVIPHLSPPPSDLASRKEAITVFSEYMGLIKYALQGRFFPRRPAELDGPQVGVLTLSSTDKI